MWLEMILLVALILTLLMLGFKQLEIERIEKGRLDAERRYSLLKDNTREISRRYEEICSIVFKG